MNKRRRFMLGLAIVGIALAVLWFGFFWWIAHSPGLFAAAHHDFITLDPPAPDGPRVDGLSGREILRKSADAYRSVETYVGLLHLTSESGYEGFVFKETREAKIWLAGRQSFRMDAVDSNRDAYTLRCDEEGAWSLSKSLTGGQRRFRPSVAELLVEYSGVSLHQSSFLPGCLLDVNWRNETMFSPEGPLLPALATGAVVDGIEPVNGTECYRVICHRDIETWTIFVRTDDFLVARVVQTASEDQMLAQRKAGGGYTGKIKTWRFAQDFEVLEVQFRPPAVDTDDPEVAKP